MKTDDKPNPMDPIAWPHSHQPNNIRTWGHLWPALLFFARLFRAVSTSWEAYIHINQKMDWRPSGAILYTRDNQPIIHHQSKMGSHSFQEAPLLQAHAGQAALFRFYSAY